MAGRPTTRSLAEIAAAAEQVFRAKGFRATGISDVAKVLGLSHGALYTYVRSKEVLLNAIDPDTVEGQTLPVELPPEDRFVDLAARWTNDQMGFGAVRTALNRRRIPPIREELGEIVDEMYSFIEKNQRLLSLMEQCARELPDLFQFYFVQNRRNAFQQLSDYLRKRIESGHLRQVPDVPTAARFMVETIAWFAWHRKGDQDSAMLDDDTSRITVRHLLLAAFISDKGDS